MSYSAVDKMMAFARLYICNIYIQKTKAGLWKTFLEANWFVTPWQMKDIFVLTLIEILVSEIEKFNYEVRSTWNIWPFFKAKWPFSLYFFSFVSLMKKNTTWKAILPFKKAIYFTWIWLHSFFFHSLTLITINVRQVQFLLIFRQFSDAF